jgi:hypothetical protein
LLYFILSFALFTAILFRYFSSILHFVSLPDHPAPSDICNAIGSVAATEDVITVSYPRPICSFSPSFIASSFTLSTSSMNQTITFPPGSAEVLNLSQASFSLRFYLPIVDVYQARLACSSPRGSSRSFAISLAVSSFQPSDDYSQLLCHHTAVFALRWCEFRNVAYFDHHFCFFSAATFHFPQPFIVPGPRAPPFDKTQDQFVQQPLVIPMKIQQIPRNLEPISDFCYVYGVFHNYHMLWHTVFDFIIPLYHFMKMLNRTSETPANRRVYVRSDGVWSFHLMMEVLTSTPVIVIDELNPSILMRAGTMGIEKLERDPGPNRGYDESIGFQYNFNRSTAIGMREELFQILKIPVDAAGQDGKPLCLLIDRGDNKRDILNIGAIRAVMVANCPHCLVQTVKLHQMTVGEQIEKMSRASILVGLHGSGLPHAVWMHESVQNHTTHLIEILPYKYVCRNWYETAARVAGVQYHPVMNKKPPADARGMEFCWNNPNVCATTLCHDRLRDEKTVVELETFAETWDKVAEQLKYTIVTP